MAIPANFIMEQLDKCKNVIKSKTYTTLEVNGNNGPGISFEELHQTIPVSPDEMFGDQLLGHPLIKEIQDTRK
jgi:hypothetical protein